MTSELHAGVSAVSAHDPSFIPWNADEVNQTIARRFERQAEIFPERIAVRSDRARLTYADLNREANRLAHTLLNEDAARGERVALLLGYHAPLIVAMLAVLKVGRTCIVLAPSHPEARLAALLAQADAGIVITDSEHECRAAALGGNVRRIINAERLDSRLIDANPELNFRPDVLAFIVYTSGSTGHPRGVMQTHRNILHNIRRHTNGLRFHANDKVSLLSSPSAAQGMATTFCALLNGATLCLRDLTHESVAGLADWLIREQITAYISAATVFRHFVRTLTGDKQFPSLRLVRLASEPVHRSDLDLFRAHFPAHAVFANTYSSTETGNLCQFLWDRNTLLPGDVLPIGYVTDDMEISLLDDDGVEVECGRLGEIVVTSRYLSPGYWNDPEQTRAAFRSEPGSDERMYFTGDLGRRHPDGCLEHVGRKDDQLKIRGFRVYPEEVKRRLCQHPRISDAFVEKKTDASGNARLVAYVSSDDPPALSSRELRSYLIEMLPEFMVPSAYVFLGALPRTPNGKVDRAALGQLNTDWRTSADAAAAARTPVEELVAEIFAGILHLEGVGIHESFFELGGDSLLVTQLLCRVEEMLRVDLPLAVLFEKPTVAELSAEIEKHQQPGQGESFPRIVSVARDRPLPLSFSQERTWRGSQAREGALGWLLSNGYTLDGPLDVAALQRSLHEVVRRHESLRTTFSTVNGVPVQAVVAAAPVPMRVRNLEGSPSAEDDADALWCKEAHTPIDLERGPMLRATLLRIHATRHWLLLTNHHIISDAWSRDNLLRELGALYAAFSNGLPSPLPDHRLHYTDFAVWQRELLRRDGACYPAQLDYWKQRLANPPSALRLPFWHARRRAAAGLEKSSLSWSIPAEVSRQLQAIGRREGTTFFMTRLAALAAHLHCLTGVEDLVVGSPITNRNRTETQDMIGFFSNLLMLRINLRGNPSFRELLGRVREITLEATAHGDIPFEELCADLHRQRVPVPQLQIIFRVSYGEIAACFGSLVVRRMARKRGTMPWGFQFTVENRGDQTQGLVLFDSALYDPTGVAEMIGGLQSLLADVAACPERRLSDLRVVGPPPRRQRWSWKSIWSRLLAE